MDNFNKILSNMDEILRLNSSLERFPTIYALLKNMFIPLARVQVSVNTGPIYVSGFAINKRLIYLEDDCFSISLEGKYGEDEKLGVILVSSDLIVKKENANGCFVLVGEWRNTGTRWVFLREKDRDSYAHALNKITKELIERGYK